MGQNRFGIFDKVTIATIVGAGALQALQQALKDADKVKAAMPALNLDGAWNYVPLALLVVGGSSWLLKQFLNHVPEKPTAAPAASGPKVKIIQPVRREFLPDELTITRLRELTAGLTAAQAKRVIDPYVGKWMRVSGLVHDVKFFESNQAMLLLVAPGETFLASSTPPLVFERAHWEDALHELKKGSTVVALGRVELAIGETIMLHDCELL